MKQLILVCVALATAPVFASDMLPAGGYYETNTTNCDRVSMQNALDNATAARRAIITVVKCDTPRTNARPRPIPAPRPAPIVPVAPVMAPCDTCGDIVEQVVDRRYFVEETVQQYRPVVHYEPAGEYVRRRPSCSSCDM